MILLDNCTHRNVKPRKSRYWSFSSALTPAHLFAIRGRWKRDFCFFFKLLSGRYWLDLNEKKSTESQTRLMSWYWKRKPPTWRKDLITYNSLLRIMFPFNWLVIILERWGGCSFEIGRSSSRGLQNFGRSKTARQGGRGSLKLDNFHGCHMSIVPYILNSEHPDLG